MRESITLQLVSSLTGLDSVAMKMQQRTIGRDELLGDPYTDEVSVSVTRSWNEKVAQFYPTLHLVAAAGFT